MISPLTLYVTMFLVSQTLSQECLLQNLKGALLTKHGVALKAHTRKALTSTTFVQCGLRCQQKEWCISINYEISSPRGSCELNDYGVDEERDFSSERFEARQGYIYSQLRPASVSKSYSNVATLVVIDIPALFY